MAFQKNLFEKRKNIVRNAPVRYIVLDTETVYLANEVGGWKNIHKLKLAVAVLFDSLKNIFFVYFEDEVDKLYMHLSLANIIIGFNIIGFDYKVLSAYIEYEKWLNLPTFDILKYVHKTTGKRISLSSFAHGTLGLDKIGDGVESVKWWRNGQKAKVLEYCKKDVEITRDIYLYGTYKKHLYFKNKKDNSLSKIDTNWTTELYDIIFKKAQI